MGLGSGIWDPGSRLSEPVFRGQKGTGSRIRIRNTGISAIDCLCSESYAACGRAPIMATVSRFAVWKIETPFDR
jgi:hypothetical protein